MNIVEIENKIVMTSIYIGIVLLWEVDIVVDA